MVPLQARLARLTCAVLGDTREAEEVVGETRCSLQLLVPVASGSSGPAAINGNHLFPHCCCLSHSLCGHSPQGGMYSTDCQDDPSPSIVQLVEQTH